MKRLKKRPVVNSLKDVDEAKLTRVYLLDSSMKMGLILDSGLVTDEENTKKINYLKIVLRPWRNYPDGFGIKMKNLVLAISKVTKVKYIF